VASGDEIKSKISTSIGVHNQTIGIVFLQNSRTKMVREHALIQTSNISSPLLGTCADLVVSVYDRLADFSTVKFAITDIAGTKPFPGTAKIADLLNDSENFTMINTAGKKTASTTILNGTNVQIKYLGA
jgi:hypothetical protein